MERKLKEIIASSLLIGTLAGGVVGFSISKFLYTPIKGVIADFNHDGGEDIIIESRLGEKAIIYESPSSGGWYKEFISGEELSRIKNEEWREDYERRNGKKAEFTHFNMHTRWE